MAKITTAAALLLCLLCSVPASAETVKARVLSVDDRRGDVRVDVAGNGRDYHVNDKSLFRVLRTGHLVVITAELVNGRHTIVDAKSASLDGRVMEIDEREGRLDIREEGGGNATYYLDGGVSARGLRRGDMITYDVEERGRRNVIVRWSRIGGTGGWSGGGTGGRVDVYRDGGVIADVDHRRTQLTIELDSNRRRQTFDVDAKPLMNNLQNGDRVRIEYERRGTKLVITSIR